jgi:selenocysteine-specific elongation factor
MMKPIRSVVVGTAGHIDHGKSALVLALTGTDPDRLKEEKARGITIDLGFAHVTIGDTNFSFVDVPGHERFVKNMLAGAGGIDLVVLVVAADESVMPQTREHFEICRLLRVRTGVVAITKSDLVDADTLELVRLEIRDLVAGSFLEGAPWLPVSSRTGQGLDEFRRALVATAANLGSRGTDGAARLPVDRTFSVTGFGTVVTGTLVSGRLRTDDEIIVAPGERRLKIRGIQVHGAREPEAVAGQRAAVNLPGIEVEEITRGQALITPGGFETSRIADAVVETLRGAKPLKHGARVRFHQGTAEILGRIGILGPPPRSANGARAVPELAPGSRAYVRVRLERPAVLTRGDKYIIRAYSPPMTIAGGHILDPRPPRAAIHSDAALQRCRQLDFDPDDRSGRAEADRRAAAVMIADEGAAGLRTGALVSRCAIPSAALTTVVETLVASHQAVRAGDVLVPSAVVERLKTQVVELLRERHRREPLSDGVPREEVRERSFAHGAPDVFEFAIDELVSSGTIGGRSRLALAGHRLELSAEEARARDAIAGILRDAGLKPPDAAGLAAAAGVQAAVADRMVKLLVRQKTVVPLGPLLFHERALHDLKEELAAIKAKAGSEKAVIDVATFKERFDITRKFAIPLLEYLDRERVTRRVGETRMII